MRDQDEELVAGRIPGRTSWRPFTPRNISSPGSLSGCSAAARTYRDRFTEMVVTAERAGYYKPDPRTYDLALDKLGVTADRYLFVAGSAYDLFGASQLGLATYWHDRFSMTPPPHVPQPMAHHRSLHLERRDG